MDREACEGLQSMRAVRRVRRLSRRQSSLFPKNLPSSLSSSSLEKDNRPTECSVSTFRAPPCWVCMEILAEEVRVGMYLMALGAWP